MDLFISNAQTLRRHRNKANFPRPNLSLRPVAAHQMVGLLIGLASPTDTQSAPVGFALVKGPSRTASRSRRNN